MLFSKVNSPRSVKLFHLVINPKKRDGEKGEALVPKEPMKIEVTRTTTLTIHHREHFLPQALLCPPCCATNPKTSDDELQAKRMGHHKQAPISQPAIKPSNQPTNQPSTQLPNSLPNRDHNPKNSALHPQKPNRQAQTTTNPNSHTRQ